MLLLKFKQTIGKSYSETGFDFTLTLNPNVTRFGLPQKCWRFFHGLCAAFTLNFVKIGGAFFLHNPANKLNNVDENITSLVW